MKLQVTLQEAIDAIRQLKNLGPNDVVEIDDNKDEDKDEEGVINPKLLKLFSEPSVFGGSV